MAHRYVYQRMTPAQLSAALDELGLAAGTFAKIYGVPRLRVLKWLDGEQDIPHSVLVMCSLMSLQGGVEMAQVVTDSVATAVGEDDEE